MPRIVSRFSKGLEGWSMQGDVGTFDWQPAGGDPGGHIHWIDAASGSDSYFVAGSKFLGDQSAFYKGKLSYDIYDTGSDYSGVPDVEITGGGITLVRVMGQPGAGWTHVSAQLSVKGGWHVDSLGGAVATSAQIKAVLADVQEVIVRAEYVNGGEEGGLDNFMLFKKDPVTGDPEHGARHLSDAQAAHVADASAPELGAHSDGFVI
ncbi:MAG TPA: laminin B domain-containing protein [Caulobacteraceae bacterium]|jgi:hypothetical protein